jgi:hypothetical protein
LCFNLLTYLIPEAFSTTSSAHDANDHEPGPKRVTAEKINKETILKKLEIKNIKWKAQKRSKNK